MSTWRLIAIAALLSSPSTIALSQPSDRQFVLYDGPDGATCEFFNKGARLKWKNRLGDWMDAAGTPQGGLPFAEVLIDNLEKPQTIDWDITKLVQGWLRKDYPNAGLMLAPVKGKRNDDTAALSSRESDVPSKRPQLMLSFADGSRVELPPTADVELNCSTVMGLGGNPEIKLTAGGVAAVRFDLLKFMGLPVSRATLRMTTTSHQYGANTIGVFRLAPSLERTATKAEAGLAATYPHDRGIEKDPAVVFATGFESLLWRTEWSYISFSSSADRIDRDSGLGFEPLDGHALQVTIHEKGNQGLDMGFNFHDKTGTEPEEIYFRYYIRFANDWKPGAEGGKLPGVAGTYGKAGWGGRGADPKEGWSLRGLFYGEMAADNPASSLVPVGTYAYHAASEIWGEPWDWNLGGLGLLEHNRWYCIEQYFRINTIGKDDGLLRSWVDGKPAFERSGIRVRDVPSIKIEKVWMNVYYGGRAPSPRTLHLFIDNVVIAKRYIGPMVR